MRNRNRNRILLFALICIVINSLFSLAYVSLVYKKSRMYRIEQEFDEQKDTAHYLIMGHSRPLNAVAAEDMHSAIGFCSSGENNIKTYYKLKSILENKRKSVSTVVLPHGFPSYSINNTDTHINNYYWSKYLNYYELGINSDKLETFMSIKTRVLFTPYYELPYLKLKKMNKEFVVEFDHENMNTLSSQERAVMADNQINNQLKNVKPGHYTSYIYLQKTIDLCKKHNIKIVFVRYPVTREYNERAKKMMRKIYVDDSYQDEILKKNNLSDNTLDYTNIYFDSLDYFKDSHHLNQVGMKAFTKRLDKDLSRLNK